LLFREGPCDFVAPQVQSHLGLAVVVWTFGGKCGLAVVALTVDLSTEQQ